MADIFGTIYDRGGQVFNVKHTDFGATGDGCTDDTGAIQAAIDAAKNAGYGVVWLPPGTYRICDTLLANGSTAGASFDGVTIVGAGVQGTGIDPLNPGISRGTTLFFPSFATKKAAIKYLGGSGRLPGIKVQGINFEGSTASVGIECNSQDGVSIEDCAFGTNAVGIDRKSVV